MERELQHQIRELTQLIQQELAEGRGEDDDIGSAQRKVLELYEHRFGAPDLEVFVGLGRARELKVLRRLVPLVASGTKEKVRKALPPYRPRVHF